MKLLIHHASYLRPWVTWNFNLRFDRWTRKNWAIFKQVWTWFYLSAALALLRFQSWKVQSEELWIHNPWQGLRHACSLETFPTEICKIWSYSIPHLMSQKCLFLLVACSGFDIKGWDPWRIDVIICVVLLFLFKQNMPKKKQKTLSQVSHFSNEKIF